VTDDTLVDYPKTVVLKDGAHLVLRPLSAAERPALDALLARVPAEDRPASFGGEGSVVLACDGERVVAAVAVARRDAGTATLGIVIDPAYRGRRLGTWLVLDAVHLAASDGVARLEAVARADDAAYLAALRRLDFVAERPGAGPSAVRMVKTLHAGWTDF
jgi:GNAT superfamily N-acetyltransferase